MKKQIEKAKVLALKAKLKRTYLSIRKKEGSYSCGTTLMNYISAEITELKTLFNQTADKLSEIDPECPKFRYEL